MQHRAGLLPTAAMPSLAVHPTQLYEALALLAMGIMLEYWILTRKRTAAGGVSLFLVVAYCLLRLVIGFLRGDQAAGA